MLTAKDVLAYAKKFEEQGDIERAKKFYQAVIDRMPDSAEAEEAKTRLASCEKFSAVTFDDLIVDIPEKKPKKKSPSFSDEENFNWTKSPSESYHKKQSQLIPQKMRKSQVNKIISAIIIVTVIAIMVVIIAAITSNGTTSTSSQTNQTTNNSENTSSTSNEKVIYEDNNLKVTFLGVSDKLGYIMISARFENKTDGELTVYPMDSSVNGTMVMYVSGVPASMQAHKNFNQSWTFNQETVGIKEASEVKNLEFKLHYNDVTSNTITINLQ